MYEYCETVNFSEILIALKVMNMQHYYKKIIRKEKFLLTIFPS
jgi:hypothetical protein